MSQKKSERPILETVKSFEQRAADIKAYFRDWKVQGIRAELDADTYETEEKVNKTVDILLKRFAA